MENSAVCNTAQDKVILPRIRQQKYIYPNLLTIMTHLQNEYKDYKYTVYRCAAKCFTLQKSFYATKIPYKLVLAVLERHGINSFEHNFMVPPFQLTALIHDTYFACEKLGHFTSGATYELEAATLALASFFWNIFDPRRYHSISLMEIKITFILLCKLYNSDQLITEFYNAVCDPNTKYVSKFNFEYLLSILAKIFTYIGEGKAYGEHNTRTIMEQCFAKCDNRMGLTEYQFYYIWSSTQSRFIIYANLIALIKRIEDTEKLIHNNFCASCHEDKIIGIRFKCQKCNNLSLCMKCFATGYSTKKHQPGHRMFEVFTEDLKLKKFTHYLSKICNLFSISKNGEETKSFCNESEVNDTELVSITNNQSPKGAGNANHSASVLLEASQKLSGNELSLKEMHRSDVGDAMATGLKDTTANSNHFLGQLAGLQTTANNALNASERLQLIIERLLIQNTKLERQLKGVQTATSEDISKFLSAHQTFLIEIINEMRNLTLRTSVSPCLTASTPNHSILTKGSTNLDSFFNAGGNLSHSLNGADINRSYLDANKSDYSLSDLSMWFNRRGLSVNAQKGSNLSTVAEYKKNSNSQIMGDDVSVCFRETEMTQFKLLLNKVKEIVEDSFSDNTELSVATQNLEQILDNIIKDEEHRRRST